MSKGAIAVDFPEEIQIPIDPKQHSTATLAGETLTLNHQPLEQAVLMLREQYAVGTVQVKGVFNDGDFYRLKN